MPHHADIQNRLQQLVEGPLQPGAVVGVLDQGRTRFFAAGYMESERRRPMPADALFRISSMGKPIIALALLQLIEDGLAALHEPVARWLPELASPRVLSRIDAPLEDTVPASGPITVEHLLSSRFGAGILAMPPSATPIQREIERLGLPGFGPDDPANPMSPDEWLRHIGELPLLAQPGESWFYNVSTLVQGILVSRIAGRPLSQQIAERITGPLGMTNTGFALPADKAERLTAAYDPDLTETDDPRSSAWLNRQRIEASMISTAGDYLAFARMLGERGVGPNGRIIGEASLRLMLSDHLTDAQRRDGAAFLDGRGWGYGVSVDPGCRMDEGWAGEIGWAGGLGTSWTSQRERNASIVVLGCRAVNDPDVYSAHVELTGLCLE